MTFLRVLVFKYPNLLQSNLCFQKHYLLSERCYQNTYLILKTNSLNNNSFFDIDLYENEK